MALQDIEIMLAFRVSSCKHEATLKGAAMNWSIEFREGGEYVTVALEGSFNPSDHRQMIEDVVSRDYLKSGMNILLDSRLVDYSLATADVMEQAANNMAAFQSQIGSGKAAILMVSG